MKGRILKETKIAAFAVYLKSEEKSENTIEKYIRDVKAFAAYVGDIEISFSYEYIISKFFMRIK